MECLIKEYGEKRVSLISKFVSGKINIEIALDAWKEFSLNKDFFRSKDFKHEFDNYEYLVKILPHYFDISFKP